MPTSLKTLSKYLLTLRFNRFLASRDCQEPVLLSRVIFTLESCYPSTKLIVILTNLQSRILCCCNCTTLMFRKRTKKPGKKNLRRKRTDEAEAKDDDDDDDENDVGIAIRNTMKKQKILASLPLTSVGAVPKNTKVQKRKQPDPGQSTAELSVLAKKHVRNMEAYIEEKMAATQPKVDTTTDNNESTTTNDAINSEEDLYRQLAREVTADVGNKLNEPPRDEGDEGDGGAMLVGTGIAEVILPATAHKPVIATGRVYNKNNASLLSSAVPEAERHKHIMSKTTPKPFVKFRNNTNSNNNSNSQATNNESSNRVEPKPEETTQANNSRQGFDAFRGKTPAPSEDNNNNNKGQTNNHRFKTGKDRDDQVYSHFLKNALNGKRR